MLKKYISILLMTVAYAILLGHTIIPHHHHDNDHNVTEHHNTEHQHDDDAESEFLNHLFSHFTHSADGFRFITSHNNTFSKQQLAVIALLPDNMLIGKFTKPPSLYSPPPENLIYISPHPLSSGLRAPPAFIA